MAVVKRPAVAGTAARQLVVEEVVAVVAAVAAVEAVVVLISRN